MAKIKNIEVRLGDVRHKLECKVNSEGTFSIDLSDIYLQLGKTEVTGRTLAECQGKLNELLKNFRESSTSKRKVILYGLACNIDIWRDDKRVFTNRFSCRAGPVVPEVTFAKGIAIDLWASVATESCTAVEDHRQYSYELHADVLPKSGRLNPNSVRFNHLGEPYKQLLEWSQEREDFFRKIITGLENVCLELSLLCGPQANMQIDSVISKQLDDVKSQNNI